MSDHYNTDGNMTSNEVNQTFYKISNVGFTSKYFELFTLFLNLLKKNFELIKVFKSKHLIHFQGQHE